MGTPPSQHPITVLTSVTCRVSCPLPGFAQGISSTGPRWTSRVVLTCSWGADMAPCNHLIPPWTSELTGHSSALVVWSQKSKSNTHSLYYKNGLIWGKKEFHAIFPPQLVFWVFFPFAEWSPSSHYRWSKTFIPAHSNLPKEKWIICQ